MSGTTPARVARDRNSSIPLLNGLLASFDDVPIGKKIAVAVLMCSALSLIIAATGIINMAIMQSTIDEIVNVNAEKLKLSARINQDLIGLSRSEKGAVLAADRQQFAEYAEERRQQ